MLRLKTYLKTSALSLPLCVVLNFSPLPPLTTILYLARLGVFSELPKELVDPEELRAKGYAKEFVEIYREAVRAQRTGRREGLRNLLEKRMRELRTSLDMMDYNVSTMMEVLSLTTIVVPLLLASVEVFMSPALFTPTIVACSVLSVVVALVMGIYTIPWELWLRRPRLATLAPMLVSIPAYFMTQDVAFSLTLGSVLSAPLVYLEQRRAVKVFDDALKYLSRATHSPNPVLAGIDLDDLLDKRFFGVARAAMVTLYVLFTQGGRRYFEGVTRLLAYVREYIVTLKGVRRKALVSLFYTLVIAAAASASMAIIVATLAGISSMAPSWTIGSIMPTASTTGDVADATLLFVALSSISYAVAAATMRDGNPLYFPLYLAAILPISYTAYRLTLLYAPVMLGIKP